MKCRCSIFLSPWLIKIWSLFGMLQHAQEHYVPEILQHHIKDLKTAIRDSICSLLKAAYSGVSVKLYSQMCQNRPKRLQICRDQVSRHIEHLKWSFLLHFFANELSRKKKASSYYIEPLCFDLNLNMLLLTNVLLLHYELLF